MADTVCRECARLKIQVERWRAVAYLDGADLVDLARREGVDVNDAKQLRRWLREFYA